MKLRTLFAELCLALSFAAVGFAEGAPPQRLLLHQEFVAPPNFGAYEASTREFIALVQDNRAVMPRFHFFASSSAEGIYTYAVPISSLADIDAIGAEFAALMNGPAAARAAEVLGRGNSLTDHISESIVEYEAEGSYVPKNPRLSPAEQNFTHIELFYLLPGKEQEASAVAGEFRALWEEKKIPDGFAVYHSVLGPDMPLLVVLSWGKDAADYYAAEAHAQELAGAAGEALFARVFSLLRRYESHDAQRRPDLSLPLPTKE